MECRAQKIDLALRSYMQRQVDLRGAGSNGWGVV